MKTKILLIFTAYILLQCSSPVSNNQKWPEKIQVILDNTTELKYDNGKRLPLYLWPAIDPGDLSDADAEKLVRELDKRGLGIICSWSMEDSAKVMSRSITIAHAQKKLGQRININASDLMYSFFNGDESTAHIDESGKPFFDTSFGDHKMGCPFALD